MSSRYGPNNGNAGNASSIPRMTFTPSSDAAALLHNLPICSPPESAAARAAAPARTAETSALNHYDLIADL
jgi:hypothetical protein